MNEQVDNDAVRRDGCVQCGHVDSPINVGPGPGWLAVALWGTAAVLWTLSMVLPSLWAGYLAALVFLAALVYTLWYFYRREKACRHCGARWSGPPRDRTGPGTPAGS